MHKPPFLAVAALVAGTSLLVAEATGSATSRFRQGGTLRVNLPQTDIDDIDPSTAYGTASWHIEYSTALKLLNYPDAPAPRGSRLLPEGASSYRVSPNGKTYTFTVRKGFRFSNGARVTAANYAYALDRALGPNLQAPGFKFIADSYGVNIVGAQDVRNRTAQTASGIKVRGNQLIVQLEKPDGTFLSKLSMPFFQAMPTTLSKKRRVDFVDATNPLPSAGPYYVSYRERNRLVTLERNPFYAQGVSRKYPRRPRRLDVIGIRTAVDLEASYQEVRANQADFTYDLPPAAPARLGQELGLNGRFRVRPSHCISYIAMNTSNRLFRNNPKLRRAVNYAVDRNAMIGLDGAYASLPTDQYLPSGSPGFKELGAKGYPNTSNVSKAKTLANGKVRNGGPWKYYYGLAAPGPQRMELVRSYLSQIGITIDPQGFRGFAIYDAAGKRNSPHAFTTGGWCQNYPDPYEIINFLLDGRRIRDDNNNNIAFFDGPAYYKRTDRAAKLVGDARIKAYVRLEHDLVTKAAPWAAWRQPANQFFFSESVDTRSFVYQPIYEQPPYNLLALK